MKILACTDGSERSMKALEQAAVIGKGCGVNKITVIYIYDEIGSVPLDLILPASITGEQIEAHKKIIEEIKEDKKSILTEAKKFLKERKIDADVIFEVGHPSSIIVKVAKEGNFDLIVIGSRGLGGLKKAFLGSVSNSVIQEADNCNILVVK